MLASISVNRRNLLEYGKVEWVVSLQAVVMYLTTRILATFHVRSSLAIVDPTSNAFQFLIIYNHHHHDAAVSLYRLT